MAWSDEFGCRCSAGMPCECNRAEGHAEPDISQVIIEAPAQYGQMPFMITNAQKEKLRAIGYDDDAISKMTPQQAHRNLKMMN
jgi:flavorubredoxin